MLDRLTGTKAAHLLAEGDLEKERAVFVTEGMNPLLVVALCERAYYLDYQNRRPDYLTTIERLWKLVKKKGLYYHFYSSFQLFCAASTDCLHKTHTEYRDEFDKLLRPKFQSFKAAPFNFKQD